MNGEKVFVREYRTYCGAEYMTVDMFQCSASAEGKAKASRSRRERVSPPKQKALNSKRAKRYFVQLANANFGAGDYHLTATYSADMLPESEEEAKRTITNYLRRVARRRKKKGLPPLKYILVTECGLSRRTGKPIRIHHHLIISGGLSREEMEMMWTEERISWKRAETDEGYARSIAKIGFVNCDSLQPGENGLEALGKYLTKDPAGKKRWSCSQNLEKPVRVRRDRKYSVRKLENMARSGDIWTRDFWEDKYPGYTLAGSADIAVEAEPPDEFNNWIIYAKLRKIEQGGSTRWN